MPTSTSLPDDASYPLEVVGMIITILQKRGSIVSMVNLCSASKLYKEEFKAFVDEEKARYKTPGPSWGERSVEKWKPAQLALLEKYSKDDYGGSPELLRFPNVLAPPDIPYRTHLWSLVDHMTSLRSLLILAPTELCFYPSPTVIFPHLTHLTLGLPPGKFPGLTEYNLSTHCPSLTHFTLHCYFSPHSPVQLGVFKMRVQKVLATLPEGVRSVKVDTYGWTEDEDSDGRTGTVKLVAREEGEEGRELVVECAAIWLSPEFDERHGGTRVPISLDILITAEKWLPTPNTYTSLHVTFSVFPMNRSINASILGKNYLPSKDRFLEFAAKCYEISADVEDSTVAVAGGVKGKGKGKVGTRKALKTVDWTFKNFYMCCEEKTVTRYTATFDESGGGGQKEGKRLRKLVKEIHDAAYMKDHATGEDGCVKVAAGGGEAEERYDWDD